MRIAPVICCLLLSPAAVRGSEKQWNAQHAATYIATRQKQWSEWPVAKRAGGACISCHTGLPFLLARAELDRLLPSPEANRPLDELAAGATSRLLAKPPSNMFPEFTAEPGRTAAAGVDAVMGVAALAFRSAEQGAATGDAEHAALKRLWSQQIKSGDGKGSWPWLNFKYHPYESEHSSYFGATVAAIALQRFPDASADLETRRGSELLTEYLRHELPKQPLHNRLMARVAASRQPSLFAPEESEGILHDLWAAQAADGGWTIASLGPWAPNAAAPPDSGSNSYATALAAFTATEAGTSCLDPRLARATAWLNARQNPSNRRMVCRFHEQGLPC